MPGQGNRVDYRYIRETTWGVTPASPNGQVMRVTSGQLSPAKESVQSQLLRSDRMVEAIVESGQGAALTLGSELLYEPNHFDLIEGAMNRAKQQIAAVTLNATAATGSPNTFTRSAGSFVTDGAKPGMWVAILDTVNDGFWQIADGAAAVAALVLQIKPGGISFLGAAKTWANHTGTGSEKYSARMFRNGTDDTRNQFSVEQAHLDVSQFFAGTGLRVGSMGLSLSAKQIGQMTFALQGKEVVGAGTTIFSGGTTAAGLNPSLGASSNVARIYKGGAAIATGVRSLSFAVSNNLRALDQIASKFPSGINAGSLAPTGSLEAYFTSRADFFDVLKAHAVVAIQFAGVDNNGNLVAITLPSVNLMDGAPDGIQLNSDVLERYNFAAIANATVEPADPHMIQIDQIAKLT
jgi:hypothetical protein